MRIHPMDENELRAALTDAGEQVVFIFWHDERFASSRSGCEIVEDFGATSSCLVLVADVQRTLSLAAQFSVNCVATVTVVQAMTLLRKYVGPLDRELLASLEHGAAEKHDWRVNVLRNVEVREREKD